MHQLMTCPGRGERNRLSERIVMVLELNKIEMIVIHIESVKAPVALPVIGVCVHGFFMRETEPELQHSSRELLTGVCTREGCQRFLYFLFEIDIFSCWHLSSPRGQDSQYPMSNNP